MLTGGVLALYLVAVIVETTAPHPHVTILVPPVTIPVETPAQRPAEAGTPVSPLPGTPSPQSTATLVAKAPPTPPPEFRTLSASDGAILKFASGVDYRLKVRTGFATSLRAAQGAFAFASGNCVLQLDLPPRSGAGPWQEVEAIFRSCGADAVIGIRAAP